MVLAGNHNDPNIRTREPGRASEEGQEAVEDQEL